MSQHAARKTAPAEDPSWQGPRPALEQGAGGVWTVRGYAQARAVLRSEHTKQAGFKAELVDKGLVKMRRPILYQEGAAHKEQRTQIARFFTPAATSANYRQFMEDLADELIARFQRGLQREGRADVSALSLQLAVAVAARVVGLTDSVLPGMARRIEAFFNEPGALAWTPKAVYRFAATQLALLHFYLLDVKPAIRVRRREPGEDVISHLIASGYRDTEILTECVTYAAAGMVTTREFISVAAWQMLETPELRAAYLCADEHEGVRILAELLRVEPVVGKLYRRATAPIALTSEGNTVTLPEGALIALDLYAINADGTVVGDHPGEVCPARTLPKGVQAQVMSFGDGHHRCPGAFVALQESDIFLRRLLAVEGLRLERGPELSRDALVEGYELRKLMVAVS